MIMRKLVIIPTYNERENVARMIKKVLSLDGGFEMLFVDDGSPDGTAEIIESERMIASDRIHLIRRSRQTGSGYGVYRGIPLGVGTRLRHDIRDGLRLFAQSRTTCCGSCDGSKPIRMSSSARATCAA